MKKTITTTIILFIISLSFTHAQTVKAGKTGLCFTFNNFAIGAPDGGIGGKYWINNKTVLRSSIILNLTKQETDSDNEGSNNEIKINKYGLTCGLDYHFLESKTVSPFFGAEFGIIKKISKIKDISTTINDNKPELLESFYHFRLAVGAEFYVKESLSLSASHTFGYNYDKAEYKNGYSNYDKTVTDKYFGNGVSSLTLTLYF